MIAKLKGLIDSVKGGAVIIDVNGVGYILSCSQKTIDKLPSIGEAVEIHIETIVREDAFQLFGFASELERDFFKLLLSVQGVGSRVALAILSILSPQQIASAIASQDKASISRADGVGPKLATRIVTELKDKAVKLDIEVETVATSVRTDTAEEAVFALVSLGFKKTDAVQAVNEIITESKDDISVSSIIKNSLSKLSKVA